MRSFRQASFAALVAAALATAGTAHAQTADVSVVGTIVPAACVPTIGGGGLVDYGKIPAASLDPTGYTLLPAMELPLSVQCSAPVKLAVTATDNRASSRIPGILATLPEVQGDAGNFGLGTVSGADVGGYSIRPKYDSFTADGAAVHPIFSPDGGQTGWIPSTLGITHDPVHRRAWSLNGQDIPLALSNLTGTLVVRAVLNKGDELPLTNEVPIDGNATIEFVYL